MVATLKFKRKSNDILIWLSRTILTNAFNGWELEATLSSWDNSIIHAGITFIHEDTKLIG